MPTLAEQCDLAVSFANVELIEKRDGYRQRLELWHHPTLGRILTINGEIQHVECWQPLYHEPLVHLPAAFVTEIREVLILGGGSLYAASQVLHYPTVRSCTLVDHDPAVLELVAQHYRHAKGVTVDPRFTYVECDAVSFLQNNARQFDIIINDGFDILDPPVCTEQSVHEMMFKALAPGGVCADVIYRHLFDSAHLDRTRTVMSKLGHFATSLVVVPEYPGTLHLLCIWGDDHVSQFLMAPRNRVQLTWCHQTNFDLVFYNPKFLSFFLYVPPYVSRLWELSGDERAAKP